jgi:penicillin-binding protein 1B
MNRRRIVQIIAIVVIVIAVAMIATAGFVYYQAIKTFEVRRVSLPTRIYTDFFPLVAGAPIDVDLLDEKLDRLGYREVDNVAQPGDYANRDGTLDIHLRGFKHPGGDHPAEHVRLSVTGNVIRSISGEQGETRQDIALEPELLASVLSDQLENRRPVTLDQVPQNLVDAIISTEDVRFFSHPGVDPIGVLRAIFRNAQAGGVAQGGSTLTQQLVKNYYLSSERTFRRKVVEAFMAIILDAKYTKREILEAYLNDIYLGTYRSISMIGVGEASRFYFGKPVNELKPAESALIAAMIRAPNNYSPFQHPQKALDRRNTVLGLMLKHKKLTPEQYAAAIRTPLPRRPAREKSGLTSIPFYVDRVLQEIRNDYGISDVKGRGLSIFTAIDLNLQDQAALTLASGVAALERGRRSLQSASSPLQGIIIAVDVPTGEIRALVGGRNYDQSQFNRALSARRQVGSLFKPFAYLAAFEPSLTGGQNITPATVVSDTRFIWKPRFGSSWSPRNYNDDYHVSVTVQQALEQSLNSSSVRIGLVPGVDNVIKTARVLGVDSDLESYPSVILGAVDVTPIEMAEAYTTIAREGSRVPLRAVRYVLDDRGNSVAGPGDLNPVQVFPARASYLGIRLMEGVVQRGTAAGARSYGFDKIAAGKTGTTNDKRDAWFIGFTPQTLGLAWIGFDDNRPVGLSGSEGAVPIWARFMRIATALEPNHEFGVPFGVDFAAIDETSGGLATPNCPPNVIVNAAFKSGTQPTQPCPIHLAPAPPPTELFPPTMTGTAAMTEPQRVPTETVTTTSTGFSPPKPPPPILSTAEPPSDTSGETTDTSSGT